MRYITEHELMSAILIQVNATGKRVWALGTYVLFDVMRFPNNFKAQQFYAFEHTFKSHLQIIPFMFLYLNKQVALIT